MKLMAAAALTAPAEQDPVVHCLSDEMREERQRWL